MPETRTDPVAVTGADRGGGYGFRHEALLYANPGEFLAGALPCVREAVERGDPVLVATDADKIALLREHVRGEGDGVRFLDMRRIGGNPGAIISIWRDFVAEHGGHDGTLWGIGEPAWPGRSPVELEECHRHECLLNLAFADEPSFRLLCPYDVSALGTEVIERARVSHPVVVHDRKARPSRDYAAVDRLEELFAEPLPEPAGAVEELRFDSAELPELRRVVADAARRGGLSERRVEEAVLAVNELATNSVFHGGGAGRLRSWFEPGAVVWDVSDGGYILDPLAGRQRPRGDRPGGFGLWIVNQVADLVQVRSSERGTVVRLVMLTS